MNCFRFLFSFLRFLLSFSAFNDVLSNRKAVKTFTLLSHCFKIFYCAINYKKSKSCLIFLFFVIYNEDFNKNNKKRNVQKLSEIWKTSVSWMKIKGSLLRHTTVECYIIKQKELVVQIMHVKNYLKFKSCFMFFFSFAFQNSCYSLFVLNVVFQLNFICIFYHFSMRWGVLCLFYN